jgi:hypothetical protein
MAYRTPCDAEGIPRDSEEQLIPLFKGELWAFDRRLAQAATTAPNHDHLVLTSAKLSIIYIPVGLRSSCPPNLRSIEAVHMISRARLAVCRPVRERRASSKASV